MEKCDAGVQFLIPRALAPSRNRNGEGIWKNLIQESSSLVLIYMSLLTEQNVH
jgi:hypothetical protein